MCLFVSNTPVVIRADKDTICYKVVRVNHVSVITSNGFEGIERKFVTPHQCMQVKLGRSYYIDTTYLEGFRIKRITLGKHGIGVPTISKNTFFKRLYAKIRNPYYTIIEEGAFHSYAALKDAKKGLEGFGVYGDRITIIKCIIPEGAKYIVGKYAGKKCYASDCIYYSEEVKLS